MGQANGGTPPGGEATWPPNQDAGGEAATPSYTPRPSGHRSAPGHNLRVRWGITRAFWGLVGFVLMGGAVFTFLLALIGSGKLGYHETTGVIIGCIACASFIPFALRKATPLKREGFWRESLRPFMLALLMAGIGAAITAIAREWSTVDCRNYDGTPTRVVSGVCSAARFDTLVGEYDTVARVLPEEARAGIITGLVLFSLLFLFITFFTGRKPRPPKPFVLDGVTDNRAEPGSGAPGNVEVPAAALREEAFGADSPTDEPPALEAPGEPREAPPIESPFARPLLPHRGPLVLVFGILGFLIFPGFGIAAWVMGNHDLRDMDAGLMDPSGRNITSAGRICGMIMGYLLIVGLILALLGAVFAIFITTVAH